MSVKSSNVAGMAALLRALAEGWGREERIALLAEDVVVNDWMSGYDKPLVGKEAASQRLFRPRFGDYRFGVLDAIPAGDMLTVRGEFTGTSPGDGKRYLVQCHDIYQFRDGKIARIWYANDSLRLAQSLGAVAWDVKPW